MELDEAVRAGRPVLLVIGPEVPVQFTAPDSNPGLSSRLPPVGGGVVPPQVSEPAGTEMALNAASTDLQVWLVAPKSSLAEAIAPLRAAA